MDCTQIFIEVKKASRELTDLSEEHVNRILADLADETVTNIPAIISENEKDLNRMDKNDPRYDRLRLTESRVKNIASNVRNLAGLSSPAGKLISEYKKSNGLVISRISVPFGVIGIIYEARPDVTFDVFSLCLKSRNACILKGGSDAINSNTAIVRVIIEVLKRNGINRDILAMLPAGREETTQLLDARGYVDLIIPRGSQQLIDYVRANATIPVIETGAGICHTYFDESGDAEKGRAVIHNAKTRRVSVCNALDCLIIHENRLDILYFLVESCADQGVMIYADTKAYNALSGRYPGSLLKVAAPGSFGTEFLSYKMAVKTVRSFTEALDHIAEYGSKHSEAIISESENAINAFFKYVDAAAVYSNASTAFTDGAEFGLGAETGISTQKLHARGPMALEALNTYKWIIRGNGQIRP